GRRGCSDANHRVKPSVLDSGEYHCRSGARAESTRTDSLPGSAGVLHRTLCYLPESFSNRTTRRWTCGVWLVRPSRTPHNRPHIFSPYDVLCRTRTIIYRSFFASDNVAARNGRI